MASPIARLALRDLRGGRRGARAALVGLALGVAAIVGVGSLGAALERGLAEGGRAILGGDVALRTVMAPLEAPEREHLAAAGTVSETLNLYAMAVSAAASTVVAVKGVDDAYPLYGDVGLDPARCLAEALAPQGGIPAVAVERSLAQRLGVKPGDRFRLGDGEVVLGAILTAEPDRASAPFLLGERLMIGRAGLDALGLVQPGSIVRYATRVRLAPGTDTNSWVVDLKARFPAAPWQLATADAANPRLARVFERLRTFFVLVGLGALVVGGVGIASAVRAYLERKRRTFAALKALGEARRVIVLAGVLEIALLVAPALVLGALAGAALPAVVAAGAGAALPVPIADEPDAGAILLGVGFGVLVTMGSAIAPLARAAAVSPLILLRDTVQARAPRWSWRTAVLTAATAAAAIALALAGAEDRWLAAWVLGNTVAAFALFFGLARGLRWLAPRLASRARGGARLALAALARPAAPTAATVVALGLGLALLATVVLVEGAIRATIVETMPKGAPSFFFLDIQPDQVAPFEALVAAVLDARVTGQVPALRGRIVRIDGVPVEQATVAPEVRWAVDGDRGVTVAATPPDGTDIAEGAWWPADYEGPPLVSLDAGVAQGLGLAVGETIAVNVLGRTIEATIANTRRVVWETLGINFTIVLPPSALRGAPFTHIATVDAPPERQAALRAAVSEVLPNVSVIAVGDVLDRVDRVLAEVGAAIRAAAAVAVAVGLLVLAQAAAAGRAARLYDAVMAKVLGATRRQILLAAAIENGVAGLVAGLGALALGAAATWAVTAFVLEVPWSFDLIDGALTALGGALAAVALGLTQTARLLAVPPAVALRTDFG